MAGQETGNDGFRGQNEGFAKGGSFPSLREAPKELGMVQLIKTHHYESGDD